jgi:hypothetical protein
VGNSRDSLAAKSCAMRIGRRACGRPLETSRMPRDRGDIDEPVQKPLASDGCPVGKAVRMQNASAYAEICRTARTPIWAAA